MEGRGGGVLGEGRMRGEEREVVVMGGEGVVRGAGRGESMFLLLVLVVVGCGWLWLVVGGMFCFVFWDESDVASSKTDKNSQLFFNKQDQKKPTQTTKNKKKEKKKRKRKEMFIITRGNKKKEQKREPHQKNEFVFVFEHSILNTNTKKRSIL